MDENELWRDCNTHFMNRSYTSAAFFANKLCTMFPESTNLMEYIFFLANCYFQMAEYPRVCNLLERHNQVNTQLRCKILAGQAMYEAKNYDKCIKYLSDTIDGDVDPLNAVRHFWLGKAYETKESKQMAIDEYCAALKCDGNFVEAFNALVDQQLISVQQQRQLLTEIQVKHRWLEDYYHTRIKTPGIESHVLQSLEEQENLDIMITRAEEFFYTHKIENAYELATRILKCDPYHLETIPLVCACMVELEEVGELYNLSHSLVKEYSESAISWYAAGAYYYLIKKYEQSRKFFLKAYKLDKGCLPAWIAYGHTFAAQDQSDQAMNAYRTVARLFPGCHLANLYMGMEYLRTKNLRTALLSFELAKEVQAADPVVWNEIGVVLYKKQEYPASNEVLLKALQLCEGVLSDTLECITFNLAHTYRKLGDYSAAIQYYNQCLQFNAKNASTYAALGLTHYLSNSVHNAVECYNKALFLRPNDRFTNDLLYIALFECCENPLV